MKKRVLPSIDEIIFAISEEPLLVGERKELPNLGDTTLGDQWLGLTFAMRREAFAHFAFDIFQVNAPHRTEAEHDIFVIDLLWGQ